MKTQIVVYRDLFNPDENILAKNRLPRKQHIHTSLKAYAKRLRTTKEYKHRECRCRHMRIGESGICSNGRCRHFEADHKPYTGINYVSYW
jgi:hypothetical protein